MIFAILSAIGAGICSYYIKRIAHEKIPIAQANLIGYTISTITFVIASFFITIINPVPFEIQGFLLGIGNVLFYNTSIFSRIKGLESMGAAFFFSIFKIITGIAMLAVGIILYQDTLSPNQIIGLILSAIAMLLFIRKNEKTFHKNYLLGWAMLLVTMILTLVSGSFAKEVVETHTSLYWFLLSTNLAGMIFFLPQSVKMYSKTNWRMFTTKSHIFMLMIYGIAIGMSFLLYTISLQYIPLGVAYAINSMSILIPIILSIIHFKEEVTQRQWIAIAFSVIAIAIM